MLVGERMSRPIITTTANVPIPEAHKLMRDRNIRRLPVVDEKGKPKAVVLELSTHNKLLKLIEDLAKVLAYCPQNRKLFDIFEGQYLNLRNISHDIFLIHHL